MQFGGGVLHLETDAIGASGRIDLRIDLGHAAVEHAIGQGLDSGFDFFTGADQRDVLFINVGFDPDYREIGHVQQRHAFFDPAPAMIGLPMTCPVRGERITSRGLALPAASIAFEVLVANAQQPQPLPGTVGHVGCTAYRGR